METELKFQIPPAAREAVQAAVATARARTVRLQAHYLDTADRRLAAAGLALRLRHEGDEQGWVQTLKGRGDGMLQRLEHEVPVPAPARGVPRVDVARHDGHPAADALRRALRGPAAQASLQLVFATDILRTRRLSRSGGAVVELALDIGTLRAGRRRAAVHELELELVQGPTAALLALAERWVQRHGLWWDVRSKAERGQRLALGLREVPATRAAAVPRQAAGAGAAGGEGGAAVSRAVDAHAQAARLRQALAHALPNLAEMADGRATPEHREQAVQALSRLQRVLQQAGMPGATGSAPGQAQAQALAAQWAALDDRLLDGARITGPVVQTLLLRSLTWAQRADMVGG